MAWGDAARQAALEARRRNAARKRTYEPNDNSNRVHLTRNEMAAYLRDMRKSGVGPGYKALRSLKHNIAGGRLYTNVKGAHFADQGLKGTAWRKTGSRPAPAWSASKTKFSKMR